MLNVDNRDRELCTLVERELVLMAASVRAADGTARGTAGESDWAGWDSLSWARLANRICESYGVEIDPTIVADCATIADLARHLVTTCPEPMRDRHESVDRTGRDTRPVEHRRTISRGESPSDPHAREPIAIVGMSLRVPQAGSLQQFWTTLVQARECITEVPAERWDWRAMAGDPRLDVNRTDVRWGAFIDGVAEFDPLFFGISPKEAEVMDPQQRLVLMCGVAAIEDAGYAPGSLAGTRTGVFVGLVSNSGYEQRVSDVNAPIEGYSASASAPSMGPNRLSYWLDLRGPSEPIETTCSSSLVALYRAMRAIQDGDCELALAGGVNLIFSPARHVSFSKAGMLSPDGHCRPFSAAANGYVRGEGVAMMFLKPLSAAERDGDEIYALLRGGAVNHGGRASSFSAPNPMAQASLLVEAYTNAGIDPRTVGYIEAHGTGTPLGDPVEIDGLRTAFTRLQTSSPGRPADDWRCGIGSVKGTLGHLEAAAGVAGLIKVVAQLQHRTLVRSLNSEPLNPRLQIERPFFLVQETQPWPALADEKGRPLPRRAGVSSFGIGGVNAHLIVEEYVDIRLAGRDAERSTEAEYIVLSARDEARLRDTAHQLLFAVREGTFTEDDLPRIAWTLQVGRDAMAHRLGFAARSLADVRETLAAVVDNAGSVAGVHRGVIGRPGGPSEQDTPDAAATMNEEQMGDGDVLASWTRGGHVDWRRIHPRRPRRIRLPTYPFARERCWIEGSAAVRGAATTTRVPPRAAPLHPLLHRNTSTLSGLRMTSQVTGEEPWLRDHVLAGRRVFPAAASLEMARAAALLALDRDVALSTGMLVQDVVFERPLFVDALRAVHICISTHADGLGFEMYTERGQPENFERNVHARGRIATAAASSPADASHDLPALRRRCTLVVSAAEHYGTSEADGVAYGPFYRGVHSIAMGMADDGRRLALADVSIPPGVDTAGYVLHPTVVDGALQAVMALRRATTAQPDSRTLEMPFAVQSLEVLSSVPPVAVVLAQAATASDCIGGTDDGRRVWDFSVCDPAGRVCVRARGLTLRAQDRERNIPPLLLQPVWTPCSVGDRPAPGASSASRHVWLAGDLCDAVETLRMLSPQVTWHALPFATGSLSGSVVSAAERVFSHLRTQMQTRRSQHVVVQVVVPSGGDEAQALVALSALFRTAHEESPYVRGQVVMLTRPLPLARVVAVLAANARAASAADTLIRQGEGLREVVTWTPVEEATPASPLPPWRDGGVYLISGGSGRLAEILAREIVRQAPAAHLVLASRTAAAASARVSEHVTPGGGSVTYQEMDVTVTGSVQAAVQAVLATHGRLTGLVHCAGVIHDNFIVRKTEDEFRAVLAPKVEGIVALDEATRTLPLECVILFASIGGVVGNAGQSDYTTANAFLDWFAAHRNNLVRAGLRHGRTLAIDWPLWAEGGMRGAAAASGVPSAAALSTASGVAALTRAWYADAGQVVVVPHGYARLSESYGDVSGAAAAARTPDDDPSNTAHHDAGAESRELLVFAERLFARRLAALLEVALERFDRQAPLETYGVDSLTGLRVVSALEQEFGRLPKTLLLDCATLEDLAQYFVEAHGQTLRALRPFEDVDPAEAAS